MLSPKQNFYEAAKGLNPDRYANQYEALRLVLHPAMFHSTSPKYGEENVVNAWGVTNLSQGRTRRLPGAHAG